MNVDIVEYIGKFDNAVFIKLLISNGEKFWDAVFYWKGELVTLTVDEDLENHLGMFIEEWPEYPDLVWKIIEKLPPYEELIESVTKLNLDDWK
jgi:hypothetical protein